MTVNLGGREFTVRPGKLRDLRQLTERGVISGLAKMAELSDLERLTVVVGYLSVMLGVDEDWLWDLDASEVNRLTVVFHAVSEEFNKGRAAPGETSGP